MNKIYVVQTYEDDSYSFLGFSEFEAFFFSSEEKAREWAERHKFKIVESINHPSLEVTLYEAYLDEL